jgi:hypothetical protein
VSWIARPDSRNCLSSTCVYGTTGIGLVGTGSGAPLQLCVPEPLTRGWGQSALDAWM